MRDPDRANFAAVTGAVLAGLLIWAAHFTVIYGFTGLACARGLANQQVLGFGLIDVVVVGATILALLAAAAVLMRALRFANASEQAESVPFLRWTAAMSAALAMIAILWEGLPALLISGCR